MVAGDARDDDGLTYDEWRARRDAERAAEKAVRQSQPKPAKSFSTTEIVEALELAFGDLRAEMDERIDKALAELREELREGLQDVRKTAREHRHMTDRAIGKRVQDAIRADVVRLEKALEEARRDIERLKQEAKK
ncbi:hypothetical protein [Sinorhizobium meliloti]|uniref:hypothetical protein n=1 Tax=Rhizobium meliloti TaxID=382 RepID=UPI003F18BFBA